MPDVINVQTAQYAIGDSRQILRTGSVGSCIVIILYDPTLNIGGLAHAMLSTKKHTQQFDDSYADSAKYVDEAIDHLIFSMEKLGGRRENFEAKLVGGATMFKNLIHEENSIGTQNIAYARKYLNTMGITKISEDTGGNSGRTVEFNSANGIVDVSLKL